MRAKKGSEKLETFLVKYEYIAFADYLNDEQLGQVFRALLIFANTGERMELHTEAQIIALDFGIRAILADREKYEMKCQQYAENGRKAQNNHPETLDDE